MVPQEDINSELKRLRINRINLQKYLEQRDIVGSAQLPTMVNYGIHEARENIRAIKNTLRQWGVEVEDHPNDEPYKVAATTSYSPNKSVSTRNPRSRRFVQISVGLVLLVGATLLLSIYLRSNGTGNPVIFSDDFTSDTGYWPTEPLSDTLGTQEYSIENNSYRIEAKNINPGLRRVMAATAALSDLSVEADCTKIKGRDYDSCGIVFRNNGDKFYVFEINADQYKLSFADHGETNPYKPIVEWTRTTHLSQSSPNKMKVIAVGTNIQCFINNNLVINLNNDRLAIGTVGLSVSADVNEDVVFEFDNFKLSNATRSDSGLP